MAKKTYKVVINRTTTHEFEIEEMNSPEEAETVAVEWLNDGEEGDVTSSEDEVADVFPKED